MTRKQQRQAEEAQVEICLRKEVEEAVAYNAMKRKARILVSA